MTKIDFFKDIKTSNKTLDLKDNLVSLIQNVMDDKGTTNEQRHILARLIGHINIHLKDI